MPYGSNAELPASVRGALPAGAQDIWRGAFNGSVGQYGEDRARRIAWSAVKRKYRRTAEGRWVSKLRKVFDILRGLPQEDADLMLDLIEGGDDGENMSQLDDLATVKIAKTDDDRHIAFGWANIPVDEHGVVTDSQGDQIDLADLEENVYLFNLLFREGDEMHGEQVESHLIESMIVTPDKLEAMATVDGKVDQEKLASLKKGLDLGWWSGWYIPGDDVWAKVKDGTYKMFSIGGVGQREPVNA